MFGYDVVPSEGLAGGSTEMRNVSRRTRSLYPWVGIPGVAASIHTADLAEQSTSSAAFKVMLDCAVALAYAAISETR